MIGLRAVLSHIAARLPSTAHRPLRPVGSRQARPRPAGFLLGAALWTGILAASAPAAWANDRPYQWARTAEGGDEPGEWDLESWVTQLQHQRGLSIEPGYTLDQRQSLQFEFSRRLGRQGGGETGFEFESEYKYLFQDLATRGWASGLSAGIGWQRESENGQRAWSHTLTLRLPITLVLAEPLRLHLSPGYAKARQANGTGVAAAALQWRFQPQAFAFVEHAVQRGERHTQAGVRWWIKPGKLALDIAAQREQVDGEVQRGLIIGIGLAEF